MNPGIPLQVAPSTVAPLAVLDLAALDFATYRIPGSGTEGCFNDLRNSRPAMLYLQAADSAVSPLLGFMQSQRHQALRTTAEALCLPPVTTSLELTSLPVSTG